MKDNKFFDDHKNKLEKFSDLLENRPEFEEDAGYIQKHLITGLFPHRNPKSNSYTITNGKKRVSIEGGLDLKGKPLGVPYGSLPRLFMAYICTQAVLNKDRKVSLGDNLADFLRKIDLDPTGGKTGSITRVKKQLWRFVNSSISYQIKEGERIDLGTIPLAKKASLFSSEEQYQNEIFEPYILLDQDFYKSLLQTPIPIDIRALKALKQSPLAIDLYMWLTHRVYKMKKPAELNWEQVMNQCGAEYSSVKNFARTAKKWLATISRFWPELDYETPRGRLVIHTTSQPHVPPKDQLK